MDKVTVSADALRSVLMALIGPPHLIRELQAINKPYIPDSPIGVLVGEFNDAVRAHRESVKDEQS